MTAHTRSAAPAFLRSIPIEQLRESALNPRRHFNETKLAELVESIKKVGVLTPLLARPSTNAEYEIAAGHRRYRAAKVAQLAELPVLVREMSDVEFLEVLTIENLQREDVHALEEAQGFADLITHAGYDVARIAERIGRSARYVYDRLRLLQLTPAVQEFFFNDEITPGHAVLLARLSAEDQTRAVSTMGALFTIDHGASSLKPTYRERVGEFDLDDPRKPMSVRELQAWIDQHVRFDVAADDVRELFPETAAIVTPAIEQAEKIISITHNYHVDPGAKPEDGERTYGPMSWKRADGQHDSKPCDRSVTGVIVVGPGRGEAFKVCTDKKKCKTHWASEQRASAQRAKQSGGGGSSAQRAAQLAHQSQEARRQEQYKKEDASRAEFKKAVPQILTAIAEQVKTRATGPTGPLGAILLKAADYTRSAVAKKLMTPGSTTEDLVRYLAFSELASDVEGYDAYKEFPKQAKALGVDVATIIKGSAAPAAKKAFVKKSAKKRVKA